jgi:hypothetical protein
MCQLSGYFLVCQFFKSLFSEWLFSELATLRGPRLLKRRGRLERELRD